MNLFRWPVPGEVIEQDVKLSKEYRLEDFLCLRLKNPSIHFTSKCCQPAERAPELIVSSSAEGKGCCWMSYKWRVLEIAFEMSSPESDTFWSLSRKRSLTNAPFWRYQIKYGAAMTDWREQVWPHPSLQSLIQDLIDSTSFIYCKTTFKSWSDSEPRWLANEMLRKKCDLLFRRVAPSVSTGELWPCAHNMATSTTPRTCNAHEVLRERKMQTWYASPNAAMLLLESEFESSFAPDIFDNVCWKLSIPFVFR